MKDNKRHCEFPSRRKHFVLYFFVLLSTISIIVQTTRSSPLQSQQELKTWTINGPDKNEPLRTAGLTEPVIIEVMNSRWYCMEACKTAATLRLRYRKMKGIRALENIG